MGERAYRQECGHGGSNCYCGFVFHSAILDGMAGQRFNDFLDPNEHVT